jgi:hypothetical protein
MIDVKATAAERAHLPGTDPGVRGPAPSRAAHVRAIHEMVRSNDYVVPAGLVAERMLEQVAPEKSDPEDRPCASPA